MTASSAKPTKLSNAWITISGWKTQSKNFKTPFFQDINNCFYSVTQIGLKPHQKFFRISFSINMAARGVQSFWILEGAACLLIEQ